MSTAASSAAPIGNAIKSKQLRLSLVTFLGTNIGKHCDLREIWQGDAFP
jgi:hypothetical protein